jgi:hypothetical protein
VLLRIDKGHEIWRQLATELTPPHLGLPTSNFSVLEVPDALRKIIKGGVTGRASSSKTVSESYVNWSRTCLPKHHAACM